MRIIFSFLTSPISILWVLLLAAILFYVLKRRKLKIFFLCLSLIWLFFISTSVFSKYPVLYLEHQHKAILSIPDSIKNKKVYILILGSGHTTDTTLTSINQLSQNALGRLAEGIRLHKQIPASKLILSGWGYTQTKTQAETLRDAAKELGIADSVLFIQPKAWNTKDEAKEYKERFDTKIPLILVTDAIHMPRSYYHFQKAGVNVIPSPTNNITKYSEADVFIYSLFPSPRNILALEKAIHEYAGLLWAYLGGD